MQLKHILENILTTKKMYNMLLLLKDVITMSLLHDIQSLETMLTAPTIGNTT